ncbi:MAG: cytochrome c biogenesis protein CcsA [Sedimentisphaerales bacterium]|nr:cytochrome c biogenesis protein CcsA [Sedimentisphaerales bacterium]
MLSLPIPELIIFAFVIILYLVASIVGIFQLKDEGEKFKRLLLPMVCPAIILEAVILVIRAVAIKAVPLTGLFESMIVLTIIFGLIYIFAGLAIRQVWFGSVMVWVIFSLIILAATVAEPASQAYFAASTPWAIIHGFAMILSGAAAMLATTSSVLYLLGRKKLKQKKVLQVLGKVPNLEKLEQINIFGLKACFILMTFGFASGIGLAIASTSLNMTALDWLTDAKIVLIALTWLLLGLILVLRHTAKLRKKVIAYVTLVTFALILFAVVGTSIFCGTGHDFVNNDTESVERNK